jgi:hypothetical protein
MNVGCALVEIWFQLALFAFFLNKLITLHDNRFEQSLVQVSEMQGVMKFHVCTSRHNYFLSPKKTPFIER